MEIAKNADPACWFSKNGEKMLYVTFDATNADQVTVDKFFKQSEDCVFFFNKGDGEDKQSNTIVKIIKKDNIIIHTMGARWVYR